MAKTTELTVLLPGLADQLQLLNRQSPIKIVEKILKRATKVSAPYSVDALKFKLLCGVTPEVLPIAKMTAIGDGLPNDKFWMRADPIHFTVDLAHVYHLEERPLEFDRDEMGQFKQLIQPLLTAFNLELKIPNQQRWYLQCESVPAITSFAPQSFLGKSLMDYFPHGQQNKFWLRLFTEIQMLLQNCEINARRRQNGKPTVDALWFWGHGEFSMNSVNSILPQIITDDPVLIGLAKFLKHKNIINTIDNFLPNLMNISFDEEKYLIAPAKIFLLSMKFDDVRNVIENYFSALMKLLLKKKNTNLMLYLGDEHCYHVEAFGSPWWQRYLCFR